jgi:Tol biopolymer transport system component
MRIEVVAVVTIATSGCGQVAAVANHDAAIDTTTDTTTAVDAPAPPCDRTKPFGTLTQVLGIHDSNSDDVHATLTGDELTVYFGSNRGNGTFHIYRATRATKESVFNAPGQLFDTFMQNGESNPSVTPDGNTIYFDAGFVIYTSTRSSAAVVFPAPSPINSTSEANYGPSVTADGSAIYVENLNMGSIARIDKTASGFSDRQTVPLGGGFSVTSPATSDDLTLFFSIGEMIGSDIQVSTRASKNVAFPTALEVAELKNPNEATSAVSWVSADGCRVYMNRALAATGSHSIIYVAERGK